MLPAAQKITKFVHYKEAQFRTGSLNANVSCGRLVNRLSVSLDVKNVTCKKCLDRAFSGVVKA